MAIAFQVLGLPGRDNALYVRVESGQRVTRLLFDCGDGCLSGLSFAEIQAIDHVCFSHLHMDHVGGFDSFFRCTFNRDTKPNVIWGPQGTSQILHHRLQGFLWNLVDDQQATWYVNDATVNGFEKFRFELREAFSTQHAAGSTSTKILLDEGDFTLAPIELQHHGPCLGFIIREKTKINIQAERVAELGLRPGAWMQDLKKQGLVGETTIDGKTFSWEALRSQLLVESAGESIAYLTDFLLDEETFAQLADTLHGVQTVVCEAQYRTGDRELAQRNHHTTIDQVARLAAAADVGKLVLFHLSDRYTDAEWQDLLGESSAIFSRSRFPDHWKIGFETR